MSLTQKEKGNSFHKFIVGVQVLFFFFFLKGEKLGLLRLYPLSLSRVTFGNAHLCSIHFVEASRLANTRQRGGAADIAILVLNAMQCSAVRRVIAKLVIFQK
jgi:hypothetical protein